MDVFLLIGSGQRYFENLNKTIATPLSEEDVDYIKSQFPEIIPSDIGDTLYIWALPQGGSTFQKVKPEDIVIFRDINNVFRYVRRVICKMSPFDTDRNKLVELSRRLWNDEKFLYFILLSFVKDINYPQSQFFGEILGKKIRFGLGRYFVALSEEGIDPLTILRKLGISGYKIKDNASEGYGPEGIREPRSFPRFVTLLYKREVEIALEELKRGRNLILYGPPGSGKTLLAKVISEKYLGKDDAYILYTVHSGTDYYDLVTRIMPVLRDNKLFYEKEKRYFLLALLSGKVLILDEINRTQIDTALGIFFTYLEYEHRKDISQFSKILEAEAEVMDDNISESALESFRVIGTLNIYDRTFLFKLGDALKRRFTFIEITTTDEQLKALSPESGGFDTFINIINYKGEKERAVALYRIFKKINDVKPLGIGILKEALLFCNGNASVDETVASVIIPFFENDLSHYHRLKQILEEETTAFTVSIRRLDSLNIEVKTTVKDLFGKVE